MISPKVGLTKLIVLLIKVRNRKHILTFKFVIITTHFQDIASDHALADGIARIPLEF